MELKRLGTTLWDQAVTCVLYRCSENARRPPGTWRRQGKLLGKFQFGVCSWPLSLAVDKLTSTLGPSELKVARLERKGNSIGDRFYHQWTWCLHQRAV